MIILKAVKITRKGADAQLKIVRQPLTKLRPDTQILSLRRMIKRENGGCAPLSHYLPIHCAGVASAWKLRRLHFLIAVFSAALIFQGCAADAATDKPVRSVRDNLLGTVVTISLYGNPDPSAFEAIFAPIEMIDGTMTVRDPESEVNKISDMSGKEAVCVSDATYEVIAFARKISEDSGGAFDLTVGPLVNLWGIDNWNTHVPSGEDIENMRKLVDYSAVRLDGEQKSVYLLNEGMSINLGGIAKGYAGDLAAKAARELKLESAILDLGGNIVLIGGRPDGKDWNVGIKTPIPGDGSNVGILRISDKSVVTSGGYERYFEENGVLYHHILDPATGYPAQSGLLSVTIVCDSGMTADMLSTAAFIMGYEKSLGLLKKYGAEGIFISADKTVYVTDGIADSFTVSNDEFSMAVR